MHVSLMLSLLEVATVCFNDGAFHDSIVFRVYTYFSMLTLVPQRPCVHPRLHWVHAEVH